MCHLLKWIKSCLQQMSMIVCENHYTYVAVCAPSPIVPPTGIVAYWFGGLDCCRSCWALKKTECAAKDAEEGSDIGRREGCCGPADDRGRTAWEDVGKVQRVAEEGSDARGSKGCCGPAVRWGGMMWEEVG